MAAERRVAELKIHTAKQRTSALITELNRLVLKSYSSPAAQDFLDFVQLSASRLLELLEQEETHVKEGILKPDELELRSHRVTQFLPALLRTLRFVSGSEIDVSPGPLVQPLRRYVRSILPGADIIVSSKAELNYSIQEIAGQLRNLFAGSVLEQCCTKLPQFLFAVNIPSTEFQNILVHAILSHELGHGLYDRRQIQDAILPQIRLDEARVKIGLDHILQSAASAVPAIPELIARENASGEISERITSWVEEIVCDVIGIHLFGPAFYFAYVYFLISFSRLDHASRSHPPIRLRLKHMSDLMERLYPHLEPVDLWPTITKSIKEWKEICGAPVSQKAFFDQIAVETLTDPNNFEMILREVGSKMVGLPVYTAKSLERDLQNIQPLILSLIPPGEVGAFGSTTGIDIASILNIGWIVYLSKLDDFRAKLPSGKDLSETDVVIQLQALILKSLEIAEIRSTYSEIVSRDTWNRQNP
jgi:hypothetical protein